MSIMDNLTCLSGTTTNMCKNCARYAREMINNRYNQVIKSLSDDQGNLNISKAEKFENLFWQELNKRHVNNFWRTDQKLYQFLQKRILKEKKRPEYSKTKINLKTDLSKEKIKFTVKMKGEEKEEEYETISTVPDNGVCRRFWNPSYYELDLQTEQFVEDILKGSY